VSRLFNKLPGPPNTKPGLEQKIWQRLPQIFLWGTVIPIVLSLIHHALMPANQVTTAEENGLHLFDYTMIGLVSFHWTLVLTVAIGCFIVRVMKGPAYVADAYPLPPEKRAP
jgi:hypothetical protein